MDMGELIVRFVGSFLFAIAVLYGAYFYLRKNPTALHFGKKGISLKENLQVESVLPLEARKNLYVIKSGSERFLIATSLEGTQFLSKLESVSQESPASQPNVISPSEKQSPVTPSPEPSVTAELAEATTDTPGPDERQPEALVSTEPCSDAFWEAEHALPPHVIAFLDLQKRVQHWLFQSPQLKSPQLSVSSEPFPS